MRIKRAPFLGVIIAFILIILLIIVEVFLYYKEKCTSLEEINKSLEITIKEQELTIENLNSEISELKKKVEKQRAVKPNGNTEMISRNDFKSYMPYTAITNQSSSQWKLQQRAYTDENGLRCVDGYPLVAIGTGWNCWVGDTILVTCENGNSFKAMVGDIKDDRHTTADNKTTLSNNCRCEFIIDPKVLHPSVKSAGSVSILQQYSGYVINIVKG